MENNDQSPNGIVLANLQVFLRGAANAPDLELVRNAEEQVTFECRHWTDLIDSVDKIVHYSVFTGLHGLLYFTLTPRQRLVAAEKYVQGLYETALVREALS